MTLYQFFSMLFAAIFLLGLTQLYFARKHVKHMSLHSWQVTTIFGISGLFFLLCVKDLPLTLSILGIIIAIGLPVFIERVSRPALEMRNVICEPAGWYNNSHLVEQYWSVKVEVTHPKLPTGLRGLWSELWLERRVASRCRGTIKFVTANCDHDRPLMEIRWADSPQPTSPQAYIWLQGQSGTISEASIPVDQNSSVTQLPNGFQYKFKDQHGHITQFVKEVDIAPGESNKIDVVVQFEGDEHCYGWNNDSYCSGVEKGAPRNPAWKLPPGEYLLE